MKRASLAGALWLFFTLFILYVCLYLGSPPEQAEPGSSGGNARASHWTFDRATVEEHIARIRLNPLISPETGRRVSIHDLAQNVVLFVPFGVLGALALGRRAGQVARPRAASWSPTSPTWPTPPTCPTRPTWLGVLLVTLMGAGLSCGIEAAQLFTTDRISSLTDVFANTGGAFAGAAAVVPLTALFRRLVPGVRARGLVDAPAFYPLLLTALLLFLSAWWPFDASLDVGGAWGKVKALRLDPWQPSALAVRGLVFVEYALFALIAALYLRQIGLRPAAGAAVLVVLGVACAIGLEASKLLIESRMPGLDGAAMSVAGVAAGVLLSIAFSTDEVGH